MNSVNPDNFNLTMEGYVQYALKEMKDSMEDDFLKEEIIENAIKYFRNGLRWAKDEMTMEEARKYAERL